MEEVTDFHTGWHIQKAAEIGANYFCGLLCVVCTQNTEKYSYELPKTSSKKQTKGEIEDRQCGGGCGEEQGDAGEGSAEQAHRPEELSQSRPKLILKLSQNYFKVPKVAHEQTHMHEEGKMNI